MHPTISGIHHLKFVVSDIERSLAFYEAAFGAIRLTQFDHRTPAGVLFGVILDMPGWGTKLELRLDPAAAKAQAGTDPISLAVAGKAELEQWCAVLDDAGIDHSPILTGFFSWLVVTEDPDIRRLRLYTLAHHVGEPPSHNERWLGNWAATQAS